MNETLHRESGFFDMSFSSFHKFSIDSTLVVKRSRGRS